MEAENPAQQFVDQEVPISLRPSFPSALRRAYAAADEVIERHPFLGTPGGRYQRGDLILLAASFEFQQLINAGKLPFDGTWEHFARPTGKHFVMLTPRARITTSQLVDAKKKPRRAVHRVQYAEPNTRYLFDHMNAEFEQEKERRLLHLLHGYQTLSFAYLTYPDPESNRHIYSTSNLMQMPHEVVSDLAPAEGPAESPDPEVIDNLEKHLRDE